MNSGTSPISGLKSFVKSIPLVGPMTLRFTHLPIVMRARRLVFPGSASFWESVYRQGAVPQACPGSFGRLAEFKAEVLNDFVRTKHIRRVIEFGCGDGAQLQRASYPEYVGVDVAAASIERCSSFFAHDSTKRFYLADAVPKDVGSFD